MTDSITSKDVKEIATLARLGIAEENLERATKDLGGVLSQFSRLQAIATTDVPTSSDMAGLKNITREDVSEPDALCTSDDLLARAPAQDKRYVKTPSVRI